MQNSCVHVFSISIRENHVPFVALTSATDFPVNAHNSPSYCRHQKPTFCVYQFPYFESRSFTAKLPSLMGLIIDISKSEGHSVPARGGAWPPDGFNVLQTLKPSSLRIVIPNKTRQSTTATVPSSPLTAANALLCHSRALCM